MTKPDRPLTSKQRAFVDEYLRNGRKGSAAYRFAYGAKGTPQRHAELASTMLKHAKIAPIIAAAIKTIDATTHALAVEEGVTKAWVVMQTRKLFADAYGAKSYNAARSSLELLARLNGFITEPTRTLRVIRGVEDLTEAELAALASEGERAERDGETKH